MTGRGERVETSLWGLRESEDAWEEAVGHLRPEDVPAEIREQLLRVKAQMGSAQDAIWGYLVSIEAS
jgi:hypothetical protein